MGLFDSDANLRSAGALVEEALAALGHDADVARVEAGVEWKIAGTHAAVTIRLAQRDGKNVLRVRTPVLTPPKFAPGLHKDLLELNAGAVYGAAFALDGAEVIAVSERPTDDLDRSEVVELIERVKACVDQHAPGLAKRHGGKLPGAV